MYKVDRTVLHGTFDNLVPERNTVRYGLMLNVERISVRTYPELTIAQTV